MSQTRIVELSQIIAKNTLVVDEYFSRNNIPTPSFDISGPARIAIPASEHEVSAAYAAALDATKELNLLLVGPTGFLMNVSSNDCVSLEAIYRFKIAQALPVGEERSFEELSEATGLNVIDLRRMLRHAMCNFVFREQRAGYVTHTATSKLLVENALIQDFVGIASEERFPAAARTVDALIKYNGAHNPTQTGFSLGHNTELGLYDYMDAHPSRGKRFAGAMSAVASTLSLEPLINGFAWASLGKAKIVDVGGGWGPVSIGLAREFPELNFVVQDLEQVVADGPEKVPADLHSRIQFMPYSILEPQPIKGAAVYFFRAVLHNWPDEYCIKILRNQIPALERGSRLIIVESCLHEPNTLPANVEKRRRSMDLKMLAYFGSRERQVQDWEGILAEADSGFVLRSATRLRDGLSYILEVGWSS